MTEDCMATDHGYSELYERALRLSAGAHQSQDRKGCAAPYITHPVHVSLILLRHGFPMEAAVAGLLHDVVEDQGYEIALIRDQFGERVTEIVAALSERKHDGEGNKRPWEVRKQEGLLQMRAASREAAAVKVADTLHNLRSTLMDVEGEGIVVFDRFSRGSWQMLDHYEHILHVARERLGDHSIVCELAEATRDFARAVHGAFCQVSSPE